MPALLGKSLAKLGNFGSFNGTRSPNDEDFIRHIDYEELQEKYDVQKYYPRFHHNYDYSTPQIKAMIGDKPVYAEASKLRSQPEDPGDPPPRSADRRSSHRSRKQLRHEYLTEKSVLRHEKRAQRAEDLEERRDLRAQHRKERREQRAEHREEQHLLSSIQKSEMSARRSCKGHTKHQPEPAEDVTFKDPFHSNQDTLVASQSQDSRYPANASIGSLKRKPTLRKASISEKLKEMVLSKRPAERLQRINSFDQTKSSMTSSRGAANDALKGAVGRRNSEVIRMYFFFFFTIWVSCRMMLPGQSRVGMVRSLHIGAD